MPRAGRERDGVADGGQRVPQLVGEHRQELVLAAVGLLQLVRPLLEGLLKLPLLGLVADDFQEAPSLVGVVLSGMTSPWAQNGSPPFLRCQRSSRARPSAAAVRISWSAWLVSDVLGREDDAEVLAEDLGLAVAEHLLGPGVPARDDALGVEREDGEARWPPRR